MSDQPITTLSALNCPYELSISDTDCIVCMDDARRPVFCTTCKKLHCFECMTKCQRENGCANCRCKESNEVYRDVCDKYSCEKHTLLLTLVCTDCNMCICKQCMGKESEHALHAFKNIDDIRADLNGKISKLYEYLKMVDGIESIRNQASNLGNGRLLNIEGFGIDQVLRDKVSQFVKNVEAFGLKHLVQNRDGIKKQVDELIEKIGKNREQKSQEFYDFSLISWNIEILAASRHTLCVKKFDDGHGNLWVLKIYPSYKKAFNTVSFVAIKITLLAGTPGRYEMKIDCTQPNINFQKMLEIKKISGDSGIYPVWPTPKEEREFVLSVGLRPSNFKYHLQCARLYREIVNDPNRKDYVENKYMFGVDINHQTRINYWIRDETGTIWRFGLNLNDQEGVRYLSANLEHYDGVEGRFDFFIKIENQLNAVTSLTKKYTKYFHYGHTFYIKELVKFDERNWRSIFIGATQLHIGIRPAVQSSKVGIIQRIFSK